jgi:hypothetical protein
MVKRRLSAIVLNELDAENIAESIAIEATLRCGQHRGTV